eukprot:scaffold1108_cov260-Pinguiococcus_pyrenoidosus.AAC.16
MSPRRVEVRHTFRARGARELSVAKGEVLTLLRYARMYIWARGGGRRRRRRLILLAWRHRKSANAADTEAGLPSDGWVFVSCSDRASKDCGFVPAAWLGPVAAASADAIPASASEASASACGSAWRTRPPALFELAELPLEALQDVIDVGERSPSSDAPPGQDGHCCPLSQTLFPRTRDAGGDARGDDELGKVLLSADETMLLLSCPCQALLDI